MKSLQEIRAEAHDAVFAEDWDKIYVAAIAERDNEIARLRVRGKETEALYSTSMQHIRNANRNLEEKLNDKHLEWRDLCACPPDIPLDVHLKKLGEMFQNPPPQQPNTDEEAINAALLCFRSSIHAYAIDHALRDELYSGFNALVDGGFIHAPARKHSRQEWVDAAEGAAKCDKTTTLYSVVDALRKLAYGKDPNAVEKKPEQQEPKEEFPQWWKIDNSNVLSYQYLCFSSHNTASVYAENGSKTYSETGWTLDNIQGKPNGLTFTRLPGKPDVVKKWEEEHAHKNELAKPEEKPAAAMAAKCRNQAEQLRTQADALKSRNATIRYLRDQVRTLKCRPKPETHAKLMAKVHEASQRCNHADLATKAANQQVAELQQQIADLKSRPGELAEIVRLLKKLAARSAWRLELTTTGG